MAVHRPAGVQLLPCLRNARETWQALVCKQGL
jgi:hypothetical protein